MNTQELRAIVDALPMTQREIAEKIGVSHGHLRNVLAGTTALAKAPEMLLRILAESEAQ